MFKLTLEVKVTCSQACRFLAAILALGAAFTK